jgi:hypothetical protein
MNTTMMPMNAVLAPVDDDDDDAPVDDDDDAPAGGGPGVRAPSGLHGRTLSS